MGNVCEIVLFAFRISLTTSFTFTETSQEQEHAEPWLGAFLG